MNKQLREELVQILRESPLPSAPAPRLHPRVLSKDELKALAIELSAALPPGPMLAADEEEVLRGFRLLGSEHRQAVRAMVGALVAA